MQLISTLFFIFTLANLSIGKTNPFWEKAQAIPVEYKGRVRSFEAATQDLLFQFSGKKTPAKKSGTQWFLELSNNCDTTPLFTIRQSFVKDVLKLPRKRRHFSYKEISSATIEDSLTVLSSPVEYSLLKMRIEEIHKGRSSLEPAIQQEIINIYNNLCIYEWILGYQADDAKTNVLRTHKYNPQSPVFSAQYFTEPIDSVFATYKELLYWKKRVSTDINTEEILPSTKQTELELYYIKINPIRLFIVSSLIVFFTLFFFPQKRTIIFALPILFLFAELLFRAVILQRFPIASLYETTIFSSLLILLYGYFKKPSPYILISALILERVGFIFASEQTLETLSPQLQNSFWLSTHVTLIILGMSLLLIEALQAHGILINSLTHHEAKKDENKLLLMGLATLFSGTVIGSLWAKESWGRYWAWDPKEVGALLLLLYSAGLFILKRSLRVSKFLLEFLSALILPLLLIVWFGINTLPTSIHSYGFSKNGLFIFLTILSMEIGILSYIIVKRKKAA